jgi:hypothetical protein
LIDFVHGYRSGFGLVMVFVKNETDPVVEHFIKLGNLLFVGAEGPFGEKAE